MANIYVLFDCPDETNDKKWLIDELKALWPEEVKSVSIHETLSTLGRRYGIKGRIKRYLIMFEQARRAVRLAKSGDTIITWSHTEGLITNKLLRGKNVKLISMNWLTPSKEDDKVKKLSLEYALNPKAHIIVNSPESPEKWKEYLGLSNTDRFHVIPDVYNASEPFNYCFQDKTHRYCFTGGMNNRNWKIIVELAKRISDCKFVCVGLRDDFEKQTEGMELPSNLEVLFDIPAKDYYSLMNNAYLVLLPLLTTKVSGLINIAKSAVGGVPCIITSTPATRQYYSPECMDMLIDGDLNAWTEEVKSWLSLDQDTYRKKTVTFMKYIEENYSPQKAAKEIIKIIIE